MTQFNSKKNCPANFKLFMEISVIIIKELKVAL